MDLPASVLSLIGSVECMMRSVDLDTMVRPVGDISVLVVDDHALFADALQARLSREPDLGPVGVAYGADHVRAELIDFRPDVVVLDLMLGDSDGLRLAEHIRMVSPDSKLIILTAVQAIDSVVTALARGVRAWLPKTVDTDYLVGVVRGVCRGEVWLAPDLLGRVVADLVERTADPAPDRLGGLTSREREVLQCMVDGLTRAEIADRMSVSVNTVRTHTQNLIAKLGTHSTLESVSLALRHGLRASEPNR
jgi:DNA-binding NarL/FixJ family response regulator